MLLLGLLAAGPALVGACLPGRWSTCYFGWYAFAVGLLLIDHRAHAIAARNDMFGLGGFLLTLWVLLGLLALGVRLAIDLRRPPRPEPRDPRRFLLAWEIPIGLLLAVGFVHWLSNRLAGFSPAWLAHLLVVAGAGVALAVLLRGWRRAFARSATATLIVLTATITVPLLVGAAAVKGLNLARRAAIFADGAPYCLLTYAGSERPRPAAGGLQLSALVMRSHGRHAVDGEPWLVVQRRAGPVVYAWRWRGRRFEPWPGEAPSACTPD